jgi:nucleoside triphosphate pyrophosphatase
MTLWLPGEPMVLASRSEIRRNLLRGAGIPVEVVPADIDEREIEARAGLRDPRAVATELARTKAAAVAHQYPDRLVLGADQTLALGERMFSKPANREAARAQLEILRGQTHSLFSAVAIFRGHSILFQSCSVASLTMRDFSDSFLEAYLAAAGDAVAASVGAYQLEKLGIQLFRSIAGDHFTILGLPLFAVLDFLRQEGFLVT